MSGSIPQPLGAAVAPRITAELQRHLRGIFGVSSVDANRKCAGSPPGSDVLP